MPSTGPILVAPVTGVLPEKSGKVVLLVDDSEDDVLLFEIAYTRAGILNPLRVIGHGQEAINYLTGSGRFSNRTEHPVPALVILDLKLPGPNGFDVLERVRREPTTKDVPVILLNSFQDMHATNRAYQLGADSFIMKSAKVDELAEQLREIQKQWL